jgi:hypothetical protein
LDSDRYWHNQAQRGYWRFIKGLEFTKSLMQLLVTAVGRMTNVTELVVYGEDHAVKKLETFSPTAWKSFGPGLRSLTLGRTFASVKALVLSLTTAPATRLVALEELCLEFYRESYYTTRTGWTSSSTVDTFTVEHVIAPFINSLAPQLRHLSIIAWPAEIDLSPLFSALVPSFPVLHHFTIRVPFSLNPSLNPSVLANFLRHNARTIRVTDLAFAPLFFGSVYDRNVASWLEELGNDPVVLSGLHSLNIYPSSLESVGINALASLTRRSAETLTSLSIFDRYLTYEEVTVIVSIFSTTDSRCNLVTLRINLRILDPPIIRLLAINLPRLKNLNLHLLSSQVYRNVCPTPVSILSHTY